MKKTISISLALAMLLCLVPTGVFGITASAATSGYYTYRVTDGKATITDCDTAISGDVTIPSTLGGYPVTSIGGYAFEDCSNLTSITIGDSVTSIGGWAFYGCTSLEEMTIPFVGWSREASGMASAVFGYIFGYTTSSESGTVRQDYNDGESYYYYIPSSLRSVTVTDDPTIPYGAFDKCSMLTSVTISDSVTSIGDCAFRFCSSLTTLTIPDSVASIGKWAFDACTKLTTLTIPDSVASIGKRAFSRCASLTSINVDIENTAYCDMDGVLYDKNMTTVICYPASKVATAYTIPDSVTSIGNYAFEDCSNLTSITIGDSVTSIGEDAFAGCTSLTSITIPDSVTSIGNWAFSGCNNLENVYITDVAAWCHIEFGSTYDANPLCYADNLYIDGALATNVVIPDSVTSIPQYGFSCNSLTSVSIPDSVTSIGGSAFYNTVLYNTSSNWENGVLYINNHLIKAKSSDVSGAYTIRTGTITIADNAFYSCSKLTSITIPDGVTSIGEETFSGCSKLTSITIPDGVTSIGEETFSGCSKLTSITIPDSVTSIGDSAFSTCYNLQNVYITDVAAWCHIEFGDSYANPLRYADNLYIDGTLATNLAIPDGVTNIGGYAFYNCTKLTSITIPDGVTSIGSSAFYNCTSLTSITIGDGVTSIGGSAFYNCYSLEDVWYSGANRSKISIATGNGCLTEATWRYGTCKEHSYTADCDESCNACDYMRAAAPHSYSVTCDESCDVCGNGRVVTSHTYDNDCDTACNVCRATREVPDHRFTVNDGHTCEACRYSRKPDAPTAVERTHDTVVLAAHEGFEYRMSAGSWQDSNVFSGLSSNTRYTFYQRVKASTVALVSETSISLTANTLKAITITFNANGGSGAPTAKTATSDIATTLPTTEPTRSGYMFAGWGTTQSCGKQYAPGEAFTSGENVTLYALWTAYDACDHCGGDGRVTVSCSTCGGDGKESELVCIHCNGTNVWPVQTGTAIGAYYKCGDCDKAVITTTKQVDCRSCSDGYSERSCSECGGTGGDVIKQAAPTVMSFSDTTVTLLAVSGHEYSKDGVNWQTSNVFTNLSPNTPYTFYRRTAPTATTPFSVASAGTQITTDKSKQPLIPDAPTIQSRTANSITLTPTAGYEYSKNGTTWQTSNVFSGLTCGTSYTFYQRVAATASHYAGTKSAGATFKTDKGTQSAPSAPSLSYKTHKTVVLCDDDGYEYSMDGIHWQASNMFTDLSPETSYLFYRRLAETETHYASAASAYLVVRTAEAGELMSVVVTTKPSKLTYSEGEALDTTGLVVTAYYSNGTNEPVTDYVVNTTALSVGTNVVTVTYGGKTATFTVSVTAKQVLSIAITTMPSKLEYAAGEELDTRGMVVTAYYDNNTSAVVSDYVVSGYSSTPGSKTVVITYHGKTASFTVVVRQSEKNGWVQESGKWAYYKNGAKLTSQWMADSVGWCYLGADGYMLTNEWVRDSVGWCYVGSDGYCVTNCWMADSVGWCYLDDNGRMATNQWIKDSVGWCYVGADGYCVTNCWKQDSVGWCYLDANGRMVTNQWIKDSVGWCYVGVDGYCVTNCWKQDSVGWCYLDKNGRMVVSNWVLDGGKWYYLDGNGYMLASTSRYIGGKTYHFNASGVCTNP